MIISKYMDKQLAYNWADIVYGLIGHRVEYGYSFVKHHREMQESRPD